MIALTLVGFLLTASDSITQEISCNMYCQTSAETGKCIDGMPEPEPQSSSQSYVPPSVPTVTLPDGTTVPESV